MDGNLAMANILEMNPDDDSTRWDTWKCRCSNLHYLFTEPKLKEDKEKGNLSQTAKTHLYEVYQEWKYGIKTEVETKEMKKGKMVEGKIIDILSAVDRKEYVKNTVRKENDWIQGECDIESDIIEDVKAPWSMITLLPWLFTPVSKEYDCQQNGYMWLYNKPAARVSWVLVDCPEELYLEEQKKAYFRSGVIWEEDPKYLVELEKLKRELIVEDYIPLEERMIRKDVPRNDEMIVLIPQKVTKAREFLSEIERLHRKTPQRIVTAAEIPLIKIK
jgi:hypothetical protein